MAIITDIETVRGRVIVRADGTEIARLPVRHFEKCRLNAGDEIDPEQWLDRVAAAQFSDAYEAALTSLDFCARSAKELKTALEEHLEARLCPVRSELEEHVRSLVLDEMAALSEVSGF